MAQLNNGNIYVSLNSSDSLDNIKSHGLVQSQISIITCQKLEGKNRLLLLFKHE